MLKLKTTSSEKIYEESCQHIPGGVNSPIRSFPGVGMGPLVISHGSGAYLVDVDGNRYIDYCMSWGALALGHAHPKVVEAACDRIKLGSSFGMPTCPELALAKLVKSFFPSMEKLRFVSSGTEAAMSAVRLARAYTGKEIIVKFVGQYHGHADYFLVKAGSGVSLLGNAASSLGVPESCVATTLCLPFNDTALVYEILAKREDVAAIIVEPVSGNMGTIPAHTEFLEMLRMVSQKIGALLIFDEVITGFRVSSGGAQQYYGITPDLTCLGKIVGGGFPAAAFGGRQEIMDLLAPLGGVYQAGTLSGNPVAMVAGIATLEELKPSYYEEMERKMRLLLDPIYEEIARRDLPVCIQEAGSMFTLFFGQKKVENYEMVKLLDKSMYNKFFTFLLSQGIYTSPLQVEALFLSSAHDDQHLLYTQEQILMFLEDNL